MNLPKQPIYFFNIINEYNIMHIRKLISMNYFRKYTSGLFRTSELFYSYFRLTGIPFVCAQCIENIIQGNVKFIMISLFLCCSHLPLWKNKRVTSFLLSVSLFYQWLSTCSYLLQSLRFGAKFTKSPLNIIWQIIWQLIEK
jgi:hypothetical protein